MRKRWVWGTAVVLAVVLVVALPSLVRPSAEAVAAPLAPPVMLAPAMSMPVLSWPDDDIINYGGGTGDPPSTAGTPCEDTCSAEDCTYMELSAPSSVVVGQWFWVEVKLAWESDDGDADDEGCYGIQAIIDFDPTKFEFEDAAPTIVVEDLNFTPYGVDNTKGYYRFMAIRYYYPIADCVWCNDTCASGDPPCPVTVVKMRVKAKAAMRPGKTLEFGDGQGEYDCILNTVAVWDEDTNCGSSPCEHYSGPIRWERRLFGSNRIQAITSSP